MNSIDKFTPSVKAVLAIHGGAGAIEKSLMTPDLEKSYLETLNLSLLAGYKVIKSGGSSVDAVVASVKVMEDSPLFNAGLGAALNQLGQARFDASLMRGSDLQAGCLGDLALVKNPIELAQIILEDPEKVFLVGDGALELARNKNLTLCSEEYFITQIRREQLEKVRKTKGDQMTLDHDSPNNSSKSKMGTVGAIAIDSNGHLAAATSTGGRVNKPIGRVGDSAGIGQGTYAQDNNCAISCTGEGEAFIRSVAAHTIANLIDQGLPVEEAVHNLVFKKLISIGGRGGAIAMDSKGNTSLLYNTTGMYRGYIDEDGIPHSFIYS